MNLDMCLAEIDSMFEFGELNEFSSRYLKDMCDNGLDEEMWQEAKDDMRLASKLGVSSEEDFRAFFYIDHFIEDLLEEIYGVRNLSEEEEEDSLKSFMFNNRETYQYTDLDSFRLAILAWQKTQGEVSKEANLNLRNRNIFDQHFYLEKYNLENWNHLIGLVNKAVAHGIPYSVAMKEATEGFSNAERLDFMSWAKFKQGRDKDLYDINKKIKGLSKGSKTVSKSEFKKAGGIFEDQYAYFIPKMQQKQDVEVTEEKLPSHTEQEAADFEAVKSKMISRTFSLDKLLDKKRKVMSDDVADEIEDLLNTLRKKVRKLKMASTVEDCFYRTASMLRKKGFNEGGEALESIASRKNEFVKEALVEAHQQDLETLLDILYEVSDTLKRRDLVRKIAEVDMKLYDMNMAGFFPELTDAQSKLIESFAYASNKIQDVIPKLRSGVHQGGGISISMDDEEEEALHGKDEPPKKPEKKLPKEIDELTKAVESPLE